MKDNPLTAALNATRAERAANTAGFFGIDPRAVERITANVTNENEEQKVAALAASLVGTPHAAEDPRSCKVCGALEEFWRTDPKTSETDSDDDEMDPDNPDSDDVEDDGDDDGSNYDKVSKLAKALTPAAINDMIAKAAHGATLAERHRLTAKDSVNALDAAMRSIRKR